MCVKAWWRFELKIWDKWDSDSKEKKLDGERNLILEKWDFREKKESVARFQIFGGQIYLLVV